jgi:hypothetical protein
VIIQKDLAAKKNVKNQTVTKAVKATALASVKAKAGKDVSRDPPAPAPAPEARIDLTHVSDSESEVNINLPSSTAPPKLEDPQNVKRTRGRTLDFVALRTATDRHTTVLGGMLSYIMVPPNNSVTVGIKVYSRARHC